MNKKPNLKSNRGIVLTLYLAIMILFTICHSVLDISGLTRELSLYEHYPNWMYYWITAVNLIGLIFLFAIWKMKKWGVFGLIASIIVHAALALIFRHELIDILSFAIGIIIFSLVVWFPYKRMT